MREFAAKVALAGMVLALAACGDKGADEAKTGAPATEPVAAAGAPAVKPGLWEQTITGADSPAATMSLCVDAATAARSVLSSPVPTDACSENSYTRNPDGTMSFRNVCDQGTGGTVTASGTISGDFESSYTMNIETTTTGAAVPTMNRSEAIAMQATWKGPCPDSMKAGDVMLPNGMTVNFSGMAPDAAAPATK